MVNLVEISNVCTRKAIIEAAKRIFNFDKICRSYCDFYFGVTFLEHTVYSKHWDLAQLAVPHSWGPILTVGYHTSLWAHSNSVKKEKEKKVYQCLEVKITINITQTIQPHICCD